MDGLTQTVQNIETWAQMVLILLIFMAVLQAALLALLVALLVRMRPVTHSAGQQTALPYWRVP